MRVQKIKLAKGMKKGQILKVKLVKTEEWKDNLFLRQKQDIVFN